LQVTFIPPNNVLHDRSRDADYRYIGEGTWERPMAKQKRSATAIAKMISERLADPACTVNVYPGASGAGSWYAQAHPRTPNAARERVQAIADELSLLYDLA